MATDAMVESLIDKVFTALLNEAQYVLEFKDQFETMKTKLELMTAFLSSTANLKNRGEILQKMLPNLRKLIYEADDILTDCQIREEFWNDATTCSSFSLYDLSFPYRTGKKLKSINSRIQDMEKALRLYPKGELQINRGNNACQVIRHSSQDYDPTDVIGLDNDIEKIKGWIFSSNGELHQVGIVGMGGSGKTTIAQKVFNDTDVIDYFEKMIWVPVSNNFNKQRIMRTILKQLGKKCSDCDESNLLRQIHQLLNDKKCLIIMDDVWSIDLDWWHKLCGEICSVIITSRREDVTRSMGVDNSRIHRPRLLNEDESWSLLCKFAFPKSRGQCPLLLNSEFKIVGRNIIQRCGGLPLAIKTIGALLAPKNNSLSEWKRVYQDFYKLTTDGENNSVIPSLQLSYDELPTHLKQCLLCFSIYPEDVEIYAEQITLWWVGEGLVQGSNTRTATELGYEYLSELASRCLIDVMNRRQYDGRVDSCKMHDLIRDMIIKIAKEEAFCNFDEQGKQELSEFSRWFGFTSDMNPKSLRNCSNLRALLVMSSDLVSSYRNLELVNSLRVLDLSGNKLDTIEVVEIWKQICSLKRLAYLNLSGVAGLKEVPYSIQKLRNLQILVLRKCSNLTKLHPSITNLKKMIILDLGSCSQLCLPHGLEKLVHLQELSGFRVVGQSNPGSCHLLELQKLTKLRVLRMTLTVESKISKNEWNVLSNLTKLKVLTIDAERCEEKSVFEMLDQLSPPPNLEELYLEHYGNETLPKWINPRQLSCLQYLCIEDAVHVNQLQMSIDGEAEDNSCYKWTLEGLRLMFMPNLFLDWENLEKDMPYLRYAELSHCFSLENFPYKPDKLAVWRKNQINSEINNGKKDGKQGGK